MEPPHDSAYHGDMNETIQAIVDLVTAVGVIYLAVRMERFIGRVEAVETAHNAHVNAPGMHRQ